MTQLTITNVFFWLIRIGPICCISYFAYVFLSAVSSDWGVARNQLGVVLLLSMILQLILAAVFGAISSIRMAYRLRHGQAIIKSVVMDALITVALLVNAFLPLIYDAIHGHLIR